METFKTFFRDKRKRDTISNIRTKKDDRNIIIKSKDTKIKVFEYYIEITTKFEKIPISFINFNAIYINKTTNLSLADLYKLSKKVKTYIIDEKGYFLAKVVNIEKK